MEVLRNTRNSPPLSLPQQDAPVDLTKGNVSNGPLFESYNFEASFQGEFPHLRLNGRVSSVVHKAVQGQSYPAFLADTKQLISSTNASEAPQKECLPLPKKRRILDADPSYDLHHEKKRRVDYDFHSEPKRPVLSPPRYPEKELCHPPHPRPIRGGDVFERPEELLRANNLPPLNYPLPSSYGIENAALMDRIMNPHCIDASTESIKETESLLAAVQHSQMLYYTYCTQLLQNLQTRRLLQEQQQIKKCSELQTKSAPPEAYPKDEEQKEFQEREAPTLLQRRYKYNKQITMQESDLPKTCTPPARNCSSSLPVCSSPVPPSPSWSCTRTAPAVLETCSREAHPFGEAHALHGRKRAPRALTGKHVRPGTGASPSTLLTLRQKLAERLKNKDDEGQLERHIALGVKSDRFRGRKR